MTKITPCLWFDTEGEEAAKFYCSVFPNSGIDQIVHYGEWAKDGPGAEKEGKVMCVTFHLGDQEYMALNGGPNFKFNEAISLQCHCNTQEELDAIWSKLSAHPENEVCGWLKDKYGLSWQMIHPMFGEWMKDTATRDAVMIEVMKMTKPDLATLERAAASAKKAA